MNLQFHLLSRIVVGALVCLLATSAYVLYRSDRQSIQRTQDTAESLGKQLDFQLLRINAGFGQARQFPDFALWKQTASAPGICVRFVPVDASVPYSLCNGAKPSTHGWPDVFETFYRRFFNPGFEISRPIAFNDRVYGSLTVASSVEMDIEQTWSNICDLMGLSAITVLAVCALVYLSIERALRPAGIIVSALETMGKGNLAYRLPTFELLEWQRTAAAINQLAASQQQLLEERQKLAVKLINMQEEERRYLARELHDEFGQCLAAINAVAASIAHSAEQQGSALIDEAEHIGRISQRMMGGVRGLLGRLRSAELDELGLAASLNSLVAGWNTRSGGRTRYRLNIVGDCAALPEPLAVTLFRIAQECLTNIAKHAAAATANVTLTVGKDVVTLTVQDDGIANAQPFVEGPGIGLLGIRERVTALQGHLALAIVQPHGLRVEAELPIEA
ncbi:histidine kinase [Methylomicrobium sp. Wu6]|uniref:histidine kinase n=1 Tax=Methylomicrobium sp. Wu6 TaxID=3107928 RepID=UPI002DD6AF2E|nr:histidine kinase [Methylomicrobium sp. Wu6]MEC4750457.1 histidine kinase [Methylomicrobium sp. Wu6]